MQWSEMPDLPKRLKIVRSIRTMRQNPERRRNLPRVNSVFLARWWRSDYLHLKSAGSEQLNFAAVSAALQFVPNPELVAQPRAEKANQAASDAVTLGCQIISSRSGTM